MLRPGKATANDAADQIAVLDAALAQLPEQSGRRCWCAATAVRECTGFVWHVHNLGLQYSVGIYGRQPVQDALHALPTQAWRGASIPPGGPGRAPRSPSCDPVAAGHVHRLAARHADHRPTQSNLLATGGEGVRGQLEATVDFDDLVAMK